MASYKFNHQYSQYDKNLEEINSRDTRQYPSSSGVQYNKSSEKVNFREHQYNLANPQIQFC